MNLKRQIYAMRKRLRDDDLIAIEKIVKDEIERRTISEQQNKVKR